MTFVDDDRIEDMGYPDEVPWEDSEDEDEEDSGPDPDEDLAYELSEEDAAFVDEICKRIILFCEELWGNELRPYQRQFAYRIIQSLIGEGDGNGSAEELTALWSRQSGKSETLAVVLAGCMVVLPKLAMSFPILSRFKNGLMVGVFAPVEEQSEIVFSRIVSRLTSDRAISILSDPEIDERPTGKSKIMSLKCGSFVRRQTASPRAKIEGSSYHIIVIDEAQEADEQTVRKSIHPMLAAYAGTIIKIGTPSYTKGDFYKAINLNKRMNTQRGSKQNHYEFDWKVVAKYNPNYAKFIQAEKKRLGEDSEEFQMSYCVSPETRILTADLQYIPARDVYKGMKLVGFDEERPGPGLHRRFKESEVEAVGRIQRPCYRVVLTDGTAVTCSAEHQWLVISPGGRCSWVMTQDLTKQRYAGQAGRNRIFKVSNVWSTEEDYVTGYLAAAFDGEGHLSGAQRGDLNILGFSQKENAMLLKVRKFLAEKGFQWWEREQEAGVTTLGIAGGRAEIMRFLGQIRPERLLAKADINRLGSIGRHDRRSGGFDHPEVASCEFVGDREVIAIRTSTRTYVAEGLASHNCLKWMLERGMLITEDHLDSLGDSSMALQKQWFESEVVVGIDPARVKDSTVVTVCWVDWDYPDAAGYREHRILNWLEIHNTEWEEQYAQIYEFLRGYRIRAIAVDAQGMGGPVADRLRMIFAGRCDVIPMTSDSKNQADRWKHLIQLLQRNLIIYPAHSKAKRTRVWRSFRQQMTDVERVMKGQYMLVEAPAKERSAHDDFVDSLSLACALTIGQQETGAVEVFSSPFYR